MFSLITLLITQLFFVLQISSSVKICRITNTNTDLFTCWYMWYQCQSYISKYYKNQKGLLKIAIWSSKKWSDSNLKDYNNLDYNSFFFSNQFKMYFHTKFLKSERNNPWFKPRFNIILHPKSIVDARNKVSV